MRKSAFHLGGAWLLLLAAAMLGLTAVAALGFAIHLWLAPAIGLAGALLILALLALLIGGTLTWIALRIVNQD